MGSLHMHAFLHVSAKGWIVDTGNGCCYCTVLLLLLLCRVVIAFWER